MGEAKAFEKRAKKVVGRHRLASLADRAAALVLYKSGGKWTHLQVYTRTARGTEILLG